MPINLGNPQEFTMLDLAEQIGVAVSKTINVSHNPLPIDDPKRRKPDISSLF